MKRFVRTLDFYGYDDGCVTAEGSNFIQNEENENRTISKESEYKVINKMGK